MAFFSYIEDKIPGWMKRSALLHWRDIAGVLSSGIDAIMEGVEDGRAASLGTNDALPLMGRDRRIVRGYTELRGDYLIRLSNFRPSWRTSGLALGMLKQLQGVNTPNPPKVRLVTGSGVWYSLDPDGTFTVNNTTGTGFQIRPAGDIHIDTGVAHPWNWDGADGAFRIWPILYVPVNEPCNDTEGVYGDHVDYYCPTEEKLPSNLVIGTSANLGWVEMIRGLMDEWSTFGVQIPYIIFAYDPDSFDPLSTYPDPNLPDGLWGQMSKDDGTGHYVKSRLATARYMKGPPIG